MLPSHFQSEPLRSSCSGWSWDRFSFLITTLHIALQLPITSFSDLHKRKHGKLHYSKTHSRSSYVNYVRPPISRTAQPCPVLMQQHIWHQIILLRSLTSRASDRRVETEQWDKNAWITPCLFIAILSQLRTIFPQVLSTHFNNLGFLFNVEIRVRLN